ncbi:hypothetical protein HMPREF1448_00564 [Helicobacter pylori HP260AFi]|uniref:Uncharacterized protein n=1 Tax=Helicobacter pylori HP260AFii TaxID=1159077 RepID=A0ABC9S7C0_HELPX|nr:hypothetical protein HMPREF1416_00442 [Helicobacter pylori GAM260ASi]EMH28646.1 hypothetical protein HMPREF1422_01159 [Helicobacter pylori GAM268Bii]EMH64108.1 hypothetical protein HMPREF1448_00564 [Helicobacter pylori HP260AFi]EMH64477.1 hypothetical protein HMPREF1449_01631 [Helicobacter pylori HP260AFii]EMH68791.1 hypothetical protein HMPREF1450_00418 [Helicobacter pylori HP260ASii]
MLPPHKLRIKFKGKPLKLKALRELLKNKSYRFTETSFYKTTASIKQPLYTPKTKFQGIMFSKSFCHVW